MGWRRFETFVAVRYLTARRGKPLLSLVSFISIIGVTIGVAAMIIVLALMTGFYEDLQGKILGTEAHLIIQEFRAGGMVNYPEVINRLETQADEVISAAPFVLGQGMLASDLGAWGTMIRGIDPDLEAKTASVAANMIRGNLSDLEQEQRGIVLGKDLAAMLVVDVGDEVRLISPFGTTTPAGTVPRIRNFKVVGIFDAGMYQYDSALAYISLDDAQRFFDLGEAVSGVAVRLYDFHRADRFSRVLEMALGPRYLVQPWMELNKNLYSALRLEKWGMYLVLVLLIVVAASNIISVLVMMVTDKTREIAILKAMGAASRRVMKIFMLQGIILGMIGTFVGSAIGLTTCWVMDTFKLLRLPGDVYYLSHVPFKVRLADYILVIASAVAISFLATIYPALRASRFEPVEGLRYE